MDSTQVSGTWYSSSILDEATKWFEMFYAYVMKSIEHDYFYKGHCQDLEKRLSQHNPGMTKSIRPFIPFILVYSEAFERKPEAIQHEKYFKSAAGRKFLKKKLAS